MCYDSLYIPPFVENCSLLITLIMYAERKKLIAIWSRCSLWLCGDEEKEKGSTVLDLFRKK
jgi:hypothetical protein